jgi:hypothetical protein
MSEYLKVPAGEPVPLSVLALDLAEPPAAGGWPGWLADRGIAMVFDDVGRRCIARVDAKKLLDRQRQDEIRKQDLAERLERAAIEADELRRAQIWKGVPADAMPPGAAPAAVMLQTAKDSLPRRTPTETEWLFGEIDTMVYHEFPADEDES